MPDRLIKVPCICGAYNVHPHLPGCPWAHCQCGRGGAPALPDAPHRPGCPAARIYEDLLPVLADPAMAAKLEKADALLQKCVDQHKLVRELRVALIQTAYRERKA